MAELKQVNIDGTTYDLHDAKPHGTLTAPLVAVGGDSSSAGKISLDQTQSGQITNNADSTLFGFTTNNTSDLTVGHSNYAIKLRGSATRPTYNGDDLAKSSDLPSNPLTLSSRSGYDCNTRYDGKVWLVAGGSNCPSGLSAQYGSLFTMPYRQASGNTIPDYGAQIFLPNGDDTAKPNSMFYRTSLQRTWNAWMEVATKDETVVGRDSSNNKTAYTIKVSSSAPASGTSSNIITIVV